MQKSYFGSWMWTPAFAARRDSCPDWASAPQCADLETVRARMRVGSRASGAETRVPHK
jgi:hypothetical protein